MEKKRVLLGMSGGVDSSVSAILLQKQGYEVIGCTMELWNPENKDNASVQDAKQVCNKLGIPHDTINCQEVFRNRVVANFVQEYKEARTPNPCIECNQYLKFGAFYEKAKELKCDYIATRPLCKYCIFAKISTICFEEVKG